MHSLATLIAIQQILKNMPHNINLNFYDTADNTIFVNYWQSNYYINMRLFLHTPSNNNSCLKDV